MPKAPSVQIIPTLWPNVCIQIEPTVRFLEPQGYDKHIIYGCMHLGG